MWDAREAIKIKFENKEYYEDRFWKEFEQVIAPILEKMQSQGEKGQITVKVVDTKIINEPKKQKSFCGISVVCVGG